MRGFCSFTVVSNHWWVGRWPRVLEEGAGPSGRQQRPIGRGRLTMVAVSWRVSRILRGICLLPAALTSTRWATLLANCACWCIDVRLPVEEGLVTLRRAWLMTARTLSPRRAQSLRGPVGRSATTGPYRSVSYRAMGGGGRGRGPPARAAEALSRVACSFEPINRSPKAPLVVVDFQWSPCLVLPLMLLATISWRLIRSTWAHVLRA